MKNYIGIDVSKTRLDVDWLGDHKKYDNEKSSIEQLIKALDKLKKQKKLSLVICEATGGYEQKLIRACHESDIPIHLAHANKVRHFAKSKGLLAKTDILDARVLSEYARLLEPKADTLLLNKKTEKIAKILRRREQLQADRTREKNRLDKELDVGIVQSVHDHIDWLNDELKKIDKQLDELKASDEVSGNYDLLTSIPAIGSVSAYYLMAFLPEIGKVSHKALAAFVGVAPFNRDSGQGMGKRFIQGGRSHLRRILYMVAISAIRCNVKLKSFYTALKDQGKPTKVALIAVINKFLSIINSVIRRQSPWEEVY